ncbi:MAG: hypothetical protein ACPG49_04830 [Chitinophagales bacterium]
MFNENNNYLELLERHFANQLTKEEQVYFNKLSSSDADFKEVMGYYEDFMVGMEDFGDKAIMLELKSLEKVIQQEEYSAAAEKNNSLQNIWKGLIDKADYTINQLAALFQPIPNYQPLLVSALRGDNIPLNKLEEEWDLAVSDKELTFSKPIPVDLSLVVENNQRESVWTTTVPKNSTAFTISLEKMGINAPGRYYLKLNDGKETVILEFFVRKDWMIGDS